MTTFDLEEMSTRLNHVIQSAKEMGAGGALELMLRYPSDFSIRAASLAVIAFVAIGKAMEREGLELVFMKKSEKN